MSFVFFSLTFFLSYSVDNRYQLLHKTIFNYKLNVHKNPMFIIIPFILINARIVTVKMTVN